MIYNKITEIMNDLIPKGKIRREDISTVMQLFPFIVLIDVEASSKR